jgi:hypothetical protein
MRMGVALSAGISIIVWSGLPLGAQGITTAAIGGTVQAPDGAAADGARARIVNRATGSVVETQARDGFFLVQGLEPGGPYTVEVRRIGYAAQQRTVLDLRLGERRDLAFSLVAIATRLDTLAILASQGPTTAAAGGIGRSISDSTLHRLPTLNGDMYDFVRTVPQVGSRFGLSGAGASFRLNNYLVDGVSDRQLQGNNVQPNGKTLSLEAVKEYQVLLSPFDVRFGDFTGLLVNAITRSGTNDLHGSVYAYGRNAQLARAGSFLGTSAYDRELYGFSLGGPIIRDRVHFFVAPEIQRATAPARGPYIGQSADAAPSVPVAADVVAKFASLLRDKGIEPGDGGRVALPNPNALVFARFDIALPELKTRLVIRENFGRTETTQFQRPVSTKLFPLSSAASAVRATRQTSAIQVLTQLSSSMFNEFQTGYTVNPMVSVPYAQSPSIQVSAGGVTLAAGPNGGGIGGASQASLELGDHLAFQLGSRHTLGMGAHAELFRYHITGFRNRFGSWLFPSLDAIASGAASSYSIGKDFGGAEAPVRGVEPSAYINDAWRVNAQLSLTLGMRVDGLSFGGVPTYDADVDSVFARRTSDYPSIHAQWSPRVGFVWESEADRGTVIRGGGGIFVGRPPLGWLVNPMRSYGSGVRTLTCTAGNVPPFTPYPAVQPATCVNQLGLSGGAVSLVDRNLRMAESFRASLAVDQRLPWNVTAGVEGLYSKVRSDFTFANLNLRGPVGLDPHGRVMYGTIDAGVAQPFVVQAGTFTEVVDLRNQSGGYSWSLTGQLHKPWSDQFQMNASYTYSRVRDVQSVTNNAVGVPLDIWATEHPLSGRWDDGALGVSAFEIPHRVVISASYVARWKHHTTDISLYYIGESGAPFTYGDSTASAGRRTGDLNADGTAADDPIYVPRNATDPSEIVFSGPDSVAQGSDFEGFINDTPCLRRQRGRIVARNSCRGPWVNTSSLSLRQSLPRVGGHSASIQLEVFNLLNLLHPSWGMLQVPNPWILQYAGQTSGATPQPKFTFDPSRIRSAQNAESGYQLQLSLRYAF